MAGKAPNGVRGAERRSWFLVALLLLLVGVTGVLTFQAQEAARSHRATAERVLRDYASVAAWGLSQNAQEAVYTLVFARLDSIKVHKRLSGVPVQEMLGPRISARCQCLGPGDLGAHFVVSREGDLRTDAPLPAGIDALLRDSLRVHPGALSANWSIGVFFPRGQPLGIGFARRTLPKDSAGTIVGFIASRERFQPFFSDLVRRVPVLPAPLLHGMPNDSTFSVEVLTPDGQPVYRTARIYPAAFSASRTLPPFFGSLAIRVALRPAAAEQLVIGGLPRSKLPLLLGLLALTVGLAVVALLQLRREAELTKMREDFVSSVSHELRTPLAQIRMFAETILLGRTRSEAERRRSLEIIDQEARRLSNLVENVLQYSRATRGVSRVVPEHTDLTAEVSSIVEGFHLFAAHKQMELRAELQDGVMGEVDRGALRQMLTNLMENAVKYGPASQRIVVGLAVFGGAARMWVDDQGPGIAPEEREKVFSAFYRSPRDEESAVAGSGIGLAVVRELATLHGGRVWAEEAPVGGARVTIEIPGANVRTPVPAGDTAAA